jgi:TP901 family phage tail tape measure protein
MANTLGNLLVSIRASSDAFSSDIRKIAREAKVLETSIKPAVDMAFNLGSAFSIAGGALTTTFLAAAKSAANLGDQLDETAEKTGVSVEELGRLKYAAEQNDSSFEGLSTGLKFLSKNLFEAATGSKEQARIFDALGIATKTATGEIRPAGEVLTELSGVFSTLPAGVEKGALAMKVFGKSGQELIPLLNQGPEGLKRLGDEAAQFGVVLDAASAKLGDQFNQALDRSKTATQGLAVSLGTVLLPSLTNVIDKANSAVAFGAGIAREYPNATKAAFGLGAALTAAGGAVLGLATLGSIAPKVAQGLLLVKNAMEPASILLSVRSYGDLSSAVSLLGEKGILAKAGMVGLAAGLGIAIGQLINMGIEMAGLQPKLDNFLGSIFGFNARVKADEAGTTAAIQKTVDALKERGIVVERGKMSEQEYIQALAKATRSHLGLSDATKKADTATDSYDKQIQELLKSLDKSTKAADDSKDKLAALSHFLRGAEGNLDVPIKKLNAQFALLDTKVTVLTPKLASLAPPLLSDMEMLSRTLETNSQFVQKAATDEAALFKARQADLERYQQKLADAISDVKKSAGQVFDDMFIKGQNVFTSLGNLLKGGALSLGRSLFEDVGEFLGPVKLAIENLFKGLIEGPIQGFVKSIGSQLGGALGGLTGGIGGNVATAATGAATSTAGVASSIAGGAASTATSLASGFISGGLAAAGSIVGAFISKGNQKRTEENTRETRDWLELQTVAWTPNFDLMTNFLHEMRDYLFVIGNSLIPPVEYLAANVVPAIEGLGMPTIDMGVVGTDMDGPGTATVQINLTVNQSNNATFNLEGKELTTLVIRDVIAPELNLVYEANSRGLGERLAQIIRDRLNMPVTNPTPVGI